MKLGDRLEPSRVQAALDRLGAGHRLRHIQRPESGLSGNVLLLETDRGGLILRTFSDADAAWKPDKERVVYGLLRQQGVPAPDVLTVDRSRSVLPLAYALSERLPGDTLGRAWDTLTTEERLDTYRQLGDYAGRMHSVTFSAFGDVAEQDRAIVVGPAHELTDSPDVQTGPFASWKEMHRQIVRRHLAFLQPTEFGDLVAPLDRWFRAREDCLDGDITPRLLHMDLHAGNILVSGGTITGLLDVEESLVGHHEFDLMRTELAHFRGEDPALSEAFFGAYTRHVALADGYERRKPFYELSRSLVWLRCLVTHGDRYRGGLEDERRAARARIAELTE